MLKIKLKKIINVVFIVFMLNILNCSKSYCMEKDTKNNENDIKKYQESLGEGCLLDGYSFEDSNSSNFSGCDKKIIVGESGNYRLELDCQEPIRVKECKKDVKKNNKEGGNRLELDRKEPIVVKKYKEDIEKNSNKKGNATARYGSNFNEDVISTYAKNKEAGKTVKDESGFSNLNINEERKKLSRVDNKKSNKLYTVDGVELTKEELEYNMSFFDKNKEKEKEQKKEKVSRRLRLFDDFDEEYKPKYIVKDDYSVEYYKEAMHKLKCLIKYFKKGYLRALMLYFKLIKGKSVLGMSLKDGDILYPTKEIVENDYKFVLLKTFSKFGRKNILDICTKKNMTVSDYFFNLSKKLYSKYKDRIYNNAENLGFDIGEVVDNFLLENQYKIYCDMLYDKDLFYYKNYSDNQKVQGYEISNLINKTGNIYTIYEDERTKINLVLIKDSQDCNLIVFIREPNNYVLKLAKDLAKDFSDVDVKKSDLGLQITLKNIDNTGIGEKEFDYDVFNRLLPILNNIYCKSKGKDILFILEDAYPFEGFLNDFMKDKNSFEGGDRVFFKRVLNALKTNLLDKLNEDLSVYESEQAQQFETEGYFKEQKKEPKLGKEFFTYDNVTAKYVADVKCAIPKSYLAKDREIFNFCDELFRIFYPRILDIRDLDFRKIKAIKLVSENKEDCFHFKIYTDSEYVVKNIKSYCLALLKEIAYTLEWILRSKPKILYRLNKTLGRYYGYLEDEKRLDEYFKKNYHENLIKKDLFQEYKEVYDSVDGKRYFKKASAVACVDWSKLYRGSIPIIELILKSFAKESYPFSDYYFDIVDGNCIEDYILRICENVKNGVVKFRNFVNFCSNDGSLLDIKIYKKP